MSTLRATPLQRCLHNPTQSRVLTRRTGNLFSHELRTRISRNVPLHNIQPRARSLSTTSVSRFPPSNAPKSKDRGPVSKEDTQTDFNAMDILQNTPAPTTGIDACQSDGFALNSGLKVVGSGVLLVAGEAFRWSPWIRAGRKEGTIGGGGTADDNKGVMSRGGKLLNQRGQWEVDDHVWGVLSLVWPKPGSLFFQSSGHRANH